MLGHHTRPFGLDIDSSCGMTRNLLTSMLQPNKLTSPHELHHQFRDFEAYAPWRQLLDIAPKLSPCMKIMIIMTRKEIQVHITNNPTFKQSHTCN